MCKVVLVLSSLMIFAALVAAGVGIWLDYWYVSTSTYNSVTTTYRAGLWVRCYKTTSETCEYYVDVNTTLYPPSLTAVKVVCCVGGALVGLAALCLLLKCMLLDEQRGAFSLVAATVSFLGGSTLLAGAIVYGALTRVEIGVEITNLYAGFALIVVASALSILGGILMCISRERNAKEDSD